VHRAELLLFGGSWSQALVEAHRACDALSRPRNHPALGSAHYIRAELHRVRGEFPRGAGGLPAGLCVGTRASNRPCPVTAGSSTDLGSGIRDPAGHGRDRGCPGISGHVVGTVR
jgi:hypothetical protein